MSDHLDDTWTHRDFPVLREVVRLFDLSEPDAPVWAEAVADATGLTLQDVSRAGLALEADELVTVDGYAERPVQRFLRVSGAARRLAGIWPTPESALDRMITALEAIAEHTDDEDTRTRARKILDGMTGAGRHIGLAAATAVVTGQLPN